ncbi:hypothetical protein HWV62_43305 [Athelia sp. TMB]|nr:hypothetical protein HWV62_43305 [Athelia sp. TMB]
MAQQNRKRPAPSNYAWHDDEEESETHDHTDGPRTTRIRHTNFNLNSGGSRLSSSASYVTAPASPEKAPNVQASDLFDEDMGDLPELVEAQESDDEAGREGAEGVELDVQYQRHIIDLADVAMPNARRKRTTADNPTKKWVDDEREEFLRELLRLDGRGDAMHQPHCLLCKKPDTEPVAPIVRCEDCYGGSLSCAGCSVKAHRANPTHRVELWNGTHFEPTTLKTLGLRIQLGHSVGEPCVNPVAAAGDDFVIVDCNGIHQVGLDFCGCTSAKGDTVQLLRARLYPATVQAPKTAATFNLLELFHLLSFESKTSPFALYNTLARRTDNTGTTQIPDRYDEFLRMIRQWRNLKMMKRAGRGHDPAGAAGTKEGECSVLCLACPQPGKNLPPDWREAPENTRFLFGLFLAADANFRMVRMKVSSEAADPSFSPGWSYFCEISKYRAHLAQYGDQKEIHSTCVKHHAVGDANTSRFANLSASGIGTVDCTRHMMKRPNSVGELQKGERYANMDYMFFHSTAQQDYVRLTMSYDIVCQWSVHLWERMVKMPGHIQIDREDKTFVFLIPKFHLPAHIAKCHTSFSFNFMRGVGRTDGEAPERGWSNINPLSASAKQMGPASYRETIDDHFGDWNWSRIVTMARILLRKLKEAVPARRVHVRDFIVYTESLQATSALQWANMVEDWEMNNDMPNPFVSVTKSITQHDVRLALAEEDAADLQHEHAAPLHAQVTPGIFIAQGLDLEAQQVRLKFDAKALNSSATALQLAKVQERKNGLHRKLKVWTDVQQLYMPGLTILRAREERAAADSTREIQVYNIALHLPSALPAQMRVDSKLVEYESRLRMAQCYEALEALRRHLRLRTHMYQFKDKQLSGQRANTRSHGLVTTTQLKVNASAAKYSRARAALTSLAERTGDVGWERHLKVLNREDIRAFGEDEDKVDAHRGNRREKALGEGHRRLSWIWKVIGVAEDEEDTGIQESLRIEWCKMRARAMRWSEEVLLLREEMRRVQAFFAWHACWWEQQADRLPDLSVEDDEGIAAYAARQAFVRRSMARSFDTLWRAEWPSIDEGAYAGSELLDLEASSSSFITTYPATIKIVSVISTSA